MRGSRAAPSLWPERTRGPRPQRSPTPVADKILAAIADAARPVIIARPAAVDRERPRAARQARSRDRRARRHHGKPARHRRRHARRIPRSDQARRPDRAARQGARLHHQMGGRAGVRSGRCASSRSIPTGALVERARKEKGERLVIGCVADTASAGRNADRARGARAPRDSPLAERGARRARQPARRVDAASSRKRRAACIPPRCFARCVPSSSAIRTPCSSATAASSRNGARACSRCAAA